jgi:Na+-driven multidrug efflux pump
MSRFSPETLHDNETQCTYLQVAVASVSIPCLVYLSAHNGFIGIWIALTIYMSLRTIASTWRYDTTALSS